MCARNCGLIDTDVQALCKCLSTGSVATGICLELASLDLSFNELSSAAVAMLAELLRTPGRKLRRLSLAYNYIGHGQVLRGRGRSRVAGGGAAGRNGSGGGGEQTSSGAALGCTGAEGSTALDWLSLAGNELCAVSLGVCISRLCPAPTRLELDCANCALSAADLPLLLTLELGSLCLDDNALGNDGLAHIARALAGGARGAWGALRSLSARNVSAADVGAAHLAEALSRRAVAPTASAGAHAGAQSAGEAQLLTLDLRDNRQLGQAAVDHLRAAARALAPLELKL